MLSFLPSYYYFISIALQAICVIHCFRRGNQQKWIYIIIFLPLVGCIAYIYTEIYSRNSLRNMQAGLGDVLNAGGRISRLENNLRFANTFNNRIILADAYLAAGRTAEAIELYEGSLIGAFDENEHVILQLITAYFQIKNYEKLIPLVGKIYNKPQFARSRAHLFYAISLGYTHQGQAAEQEFKKMKAKFSNFEARYQYGLFLRRAGRIQEARTVFSEIVDEAPHLSTRERRDSRPWIAQAKGALKEV